MISRIEVLLRYIRRLLSRSDLAIRLLRLSRLTKPTESPGLVMVQIDGLSYTQFSKALQKGRIPFLASLLTQERYVLHPFYSGLPSNTPAVQAELFYGIKTCVPSFSFIDRKTKQLVKMFDVPYVETFEPTLKTQGEGLLNGGSSYSNIYTGGAKESHFCWGQLGWSGVLHAINPLVFPFFVILYIDIFIRTFFLLVIEFFIAFIECIRGTLKGRIFAEEIRFVWLRVLICVFLREVIVAGACMDIIRGLPIIHLNFLGYDEQAHCRGPSSRYAHWSLQGIDNAIKRLNDVLKNSPCREYDLWVYSDHGQERTVPYLIKYGRTIEEAVAHLFGSTQVPTSLRMSSVKSREGKALKNKKGSLPLLVDFTSQEAIVAAMGPLGQIYIKKRLEAKEIDFFARKLVTDLGIPLVLTRHQDTKVLAHTPQGNFVLPEQAANVFGEDHPFLEEIKKDIIPMCWHPDAGEFTIAGWSKGQASISFPLESGAHAGMSVEETRAFALLPVDAPVNPKQNYMRPLDLRKAAQKHLKNEKSDPVTMPLAIPSLKTIRIMSYNVHGCLGMDGHISTDRIARVIARNNPDIIALQELDALRSRSNGIEQAHKIAQYLEMKYHFHPVFCRQEEQYGNAILSRLPVSLERMAALPQLKKKEMYEPRGAMSIILELNGVKIKIINTHLSIWPRERIVQIEALLGKEWMGDGNGHTILCGDFNAMPGSAAYRTICTKFKDSQAIIAGHRPYSTWFGRYPLTQIDHIFVTPQFKVVSAYVSHTSLDKVASDHLPLMVDLSFISN